MVLRITTPPTRKHHDSQCGARRGARSLLLPVYYCPTGRFCRVSPASMLQSRLRLQCDVRETLHTHEVLQLCASMRKMTFSGLDSISSNRFLGSN